ncbi:MAG TPA: peptidoglycan-binding protein [Pyrinomonadaceae bacterium]|nr:peptidoglycan-binding protein [Pyrinomonadaceae bacterium]
MPILQQGSTGPEVTDLQNRLKELGFDPHGVDGNFGAGTKGAVIAFQQSKGLTADGKAGPATLAALGATTGSPDAGVISGNGGAGGTSATLNVSVAQVSQMFPGTPVANIKTNLPFVLQALSDAGLTDKQMILMALATIRAETASFRPISEGISKHNTTPGKHPFNRYDNRGEGSLGNQGRPDGERFKGRGFVQLTGRANYKQHGAAIGLGNQLIENPEMANQPDIAAKLLASFIKSKEQKIRKALAQGNLVAARKLVNGGSHGLDEFTHAFKKGKNILA